MITGFNPTRLQAITIDQITVGRKQFNSYQSNCSSSKSIARDIQIIGGIFKNCGGEM